MAEVLSGQRTVATAGTAVALSATSLLVRAVAIKALPGNSGVVYIGNDGAGDVTAANGYPLSPGDQILREAPVGDDYARGDLDLADTWVDAAENGDAVAWLRLR